MDFIFTLFYSYFKKLEDVFFLQRVIPKNRLLKECLFELKKAYLGSSPYRVCHQFFLQKGMKDPYVYGQTPIKTLYDLGKRLDLSPGDTVLDLGCGEGRALFFLSCYFGCQGIGIDIVEEFIRKANKITYDFGLGNRLTFEWGSIDTHTIPHADVIFLAGSCMENELLCRLCAKLKKLPKETKLITVSFPLEEIADGFIIQEEIEADFYWGKTSLFIQQCR